MNVGVIGATGYAGQQLVGLLVNHPQVTINFLSSHSYEGKNYASICSQFHEVIDLKCCSIEDALRLIKDIDVLFIALPHGKSLEIVSQIKDEEVKIIDFGADFRMNDVETIKEWYDLHHDDRQLLEQGIYGLAEYNRREIESAKLVANPGCYPTATLLGILPIIQSEVINKSSIIVDAKSGVSGAGRNSQGTSYCETNENMKAYSIGCHRHIPEIEEVLSTVAGENINISFTPHLVPMQRGIIAAIYIQLKEEVSIDEIYKLYCDYYKDSVFVRIKKGAPEIKYVSRTNYCDIGLFYDQRVNRLIVISAIDNLMKGAAGAAVQSMNLMMGYPEPLGLIGNHYYL